MLFAGAALAAGAAFLRAAGAALALGEDAAAVLRAGAAFFAAVGFLAEAAFLLRAEELDFAGIKVTLVNREYLLTSVSLGRLVGILRIEINGKFTMRASGFSYCAILHFTIIKW